MDGGGCEDEIRNHNDPGDTRDDGGLSAKVRRKHEKSNASSRAKQHGGADDMEIFQNEIQHYRSSRTANATKCSTIIGQIFSIGPKGSAQRRGTSMVPMVA